MDVWDSDGEEPGQMAQIEREHFNKGYLDGITRSKESSLQTGFDDGYPYGAEIGLQAGRILGQLQGMGLHDLEASAQKELQAARIFSYEFYNKETQPLFEGMHPLVAKWEKTVASLAVNTEAVSLRPRR